MTRPQNIEILKEARAAFKARGVTPQQRAREKIALSTAWIYRHGYSSADVLARLMGVKTRPGIAANLVKWGLAKSTEIEGGGLVRGVPLHLFTLTEAGINEAMNYVEIALNYDTKPYKTIRKDTIKHNMIIQNLTVGALVNGSIDGYFTERELHQLNADEVKDRHSTYAAKIPDALWVNGYNRAAIELELSAKWARKLDVFVEGLLVGRDKNRWDDVIVFVKTEQTRARYLEAFSEGAEVPHWVTNAQYHWFKSDANPRVITQSEAGKITVKTLEI